MQIKDKNVIITGGASGVGKELTKQMLKKGCNVAYIDINEENLEKLKQELNSDRLKTYVVDMGNIESIKELSLSEGLEIAPYLGEDVKDYYRGIFEKHSVGEIKKLLNESDSEKIDNFFGRFMFGGDGGDFLPHQYFGCPGLLTKLFGLQPEDQHALTLEDVIELMKEIRAESGSNNEGNEPFALDDAVLWKKIREKYNIQPDEVGGSGLGYETYFLDDDYSEVLLTRPGLVAVLKYDYEGSNVRVSDWWDSGSGLTPETVFPYADTSECVVFTLD